MSEQRRGGNWELFRKTHTRLVVVPATNFGKPAVALDEAAVVPNLWVNILEISTSKRPLLRILSEQEEKSVKLV